MTARKHVEAALEAIREFDRHMTAAAVAAEISAPPRVELGLRGSLEGLLDLLELKGRGNVEAGP